MKWPFVSRGTLDLATAELLRSEARYDVLHAAYVELNGKMFAMMLDATKKPEPVKMPERTRDQVIDAIMMRAGTNGQLRTHLSAWAMQQRREQVPDDQIINSIVVWASPDDDDPSAGVP
jgi:hypothetical protein